ncbi:protein serine/threonine phosphatase 2C [Athelia psychrophila]|uniref:Protein serine/threonine phosphatase 2C n=1 Tax=Athelia psychrophila TaxID=1759441 RepID=A0A166X8Z9_9AGAM|nr:protein serine/threonine phosphatase 2C [Fibularhizoctonia sp. CBS 109695]
MGFEGAGPWAYRKLSGTELTKELTRLANAQSIHGADVVSLQPCTISRSQDRFIVSQLDVPGGQWRFNGVFDGHAGEETVDHILNKLPSLFHSFLAEALRLAGDGELHHDDVSKVLVDSISELDNSITRDILELFPGGPDGLEKLSDEQIDTIVNDFESGGVNNAKLLRGMRGSTVLVALVDPSGRNLYVASLGDCQAVLGTKTPSGTWKAELLSQNHNGKDLAEVARIHREHPGEDATCVLEDRVLGAIAVTRAIGDHEFRLPAIFTERVFVRTKPGFKLSSVLADWLPRNKTPPYLSNVADVVHVDLTATEREGRFLIMCSDGLTDLYLHDDDRKDINTLQEVADAIVNAFSDRSTTSGVDDNTALHLLREAMGGSDEDKVSRNVTVEMAFRWMDDVTIIIQSI